MVTRYRQPGLVMLGGLMMLVVGPGRAQATAAVPPPEEEAEWQDDDPQAEKQDRRGDRFDRRRRDRSWRDAARGPRGDRHRRWRVPEEVEAKWLAIIEERLPRHHRRLMRIKEDHPRRYQQIVRRSAPMIREYMHWKEARPEIAETIFKEFEIEERLRDLGLQHSQMAPEEPRRAEIAAEIEQLVREQFETKKTRRAARLEEFARRIERQQERLAEERARFDEDVERMETLVAERVEAIKSGEVGDEAREGPPRGRRERGAFEDGDRKWRHRHPDGPRHREPPAEEQDTDRP